MLPKFSYAKKSDRVLGSHTTVILLSQMYSMIFLARISRHISLLPERVSQLCDLCVNLSIIVWCHLYCAKERSLVGYFYPALRPWVGVGGGG
jgi:hypothetical protein